MKKLFLTLLGIVLATSLCYVNTSFAAPVNKSIIGATILDNSPTSVTSTTVNIQDYKKVGVIVGYDETEVGNSISLSVTIDFSYDGTNWFDGSFYDFAGGSTIQTSETISSDGWYYLWIDPDWSWPPYFRVVLAATNTDADDLAVVVSYLVGTK